MVLPRGLIIGLDELTVALWVRPETIANNVRVLDLGFNRRTYFYVCARTGSKKARFSMKTYGMEGEDFVDAPGALPEGTWTHVAVTAGGSGAVLYLYLDGALAGRKDDLIMSPLVLGATSQNFLGRSQDSRNPAIQLVALLVHRYYELPLMRRWSRPLQRTAALTTSPPEENRKPLSAKD